MKTRIRARWCAYDADQKKRYRSTSDLEISKATRGYKKSSFRIMLTAGLINMELSRSDALQLANMLVDMAETGEIEAVD